MTETIRLTAAMEKHTDRLTAWARANGLDPNLIPVPSTVTFDGDRMTVEQYVLNEAGKKQLDPGKDALLRSTVTVDLLEPFPADVLAVERLRNQIEGDPA
jgi:hypothetical protein